MARLAEALRTFDPTPFMRVNGADRQRVSSWRDGTEGSLVFYYERPGENGAPPQAYLIRTQAPWIIETIQRSVGTQVDGLFGPLTLAAIIARMRDAGENVSEGAAPSHLVLQWALRHALFNDRGAVAFPSRMVWPDPSHPARAPGSSSYLGLWSIDRGAQARPDEVAPPVTAPVTLVTEAQPPAPTPTPPAPTPTPTPPAPPAPPTVQPGATPPPAPNGFAYVPNQQGVLLLMRVLDTLGQGQSPRPPEQGQAWTYDVNGRMVLVEYGGAQPSPNGAPPPQGACPNGWFTGPTGLCKPTDPALLPHQAPQSTPPQPTTPAQPSEPSPERPVQGVSVDRELARQASMSSWAFPRLVAINPTTRKRAVGAALLFGTVGVGAGALVFGLGRVLSTGGHKPQRSDE